ncbi:MAG TPA: DUF4097 family beta strand repeat-containing protein [Xanthomonadales bacterium]|nr:DUF4097 family beta strand repeat-containing protein [Xanthomonadales bacterium]
MITRLTQKEFSSASRRTSNVRWLAAAFFAMAISVHADVTEVEEFSFELDEGGKLNVENINGDITVTAGSGNKVIVIATKKADDQDYLDGMEIHVKASSSRISLRTEHPKSSRRWFGTNSNGSVSFEIIAPAGANLDSIETVNGEIEIAGIEGDVSADTTNGDIHISDLRGNLEADTVNGSVNATFASLGGDQRVSAETVNGRIQLKLPENTSAKVDAGTVNGGIDADDFGLHVDKGFLGRDCSGEIGDGDARIKLSTVNGAIKIRRI